MVEMRPPRQGPPQPATLITSVGPREGEHGLMLERALSSVSGAPLPRVVSAAENPDPYDLSQLWSEPQAYNTMQRKDWKWKKAPADQQRSEEELKAMRARRVTFVLTNGAQTRR